MDDDNKESLILRSQSEMNDAIKELEEKIREYGSFNVIANSMVRTQLQQRSFNASLGPEPSAVNTEYLALICLKFPFSIGYREFSHVREVAKDLYEIEELGMKVMFLYSLIHMHKYRDGKAAGEHFDIKHFAEAMSSEELLIRNETFEDHHWDLLEGLYAPYDEFIKVKLGFSVGEAIRLCETIADYCGETIEECGKQIRSSVSGMYAEAIDYKYRNKTPKNFYPPEFLEHFKRTEDRQLKWEFERSAMTYEMVMLGHTISFTVRDLAEMEKIDVAIVRKFLDKLSIGFGEISPDFARPEIMHPLKDRPLIRHEDRHICPSLSLLDYSLDRVFSDLLLKDPIKKEKYKDGRHDYLMGEGMAYLRDVLKPRLFYTNLIYDGGEMDGFIEVDGNAFFIEGKGHRITDPAKRGYIDRLKTHVEQIVKASHAQATKAYQYLHGKPAAQFRDKQGRKVVIDGTKIKKAFFISLTIDNLRAISCNLKVNNSLGLFQPDSFPWLVSLYDLRVVCEHMEGPSYLIHYLYRRSQFFTHDKFHVHDELDLLGYYLKQNLRFDSLPKKDYDKATVINLTTMTPQFNAYYFSQQGIGPAGVAKMAHYTAWPVKSMIKTLEECGLANGINAAVQILEMGENSRGQFVNGIKTIRKKYKRDGKNHDFRLAGDNWEGVTWMVSYWLAPDTDQYRKFFSQFVLKKHKEDPHHRYIAIFDTGKEGYDFREILYLMS